MVTVKKVSQDKTKPIVIQNFVVSRPPNRTNFDIANWRTALAHAEMDGGNRVDLYDLYSDVMLDPHLSSQWSKRVMNITNTDVMFTRNGKTVDQMKDLMDSPEFEELLQEIMNAVAWGITVFEIGNEKVTEMGAEVMRMTLYLVDRKHLRPKEGVITKEQHGSNEEGIKYREGLYRNYVAEVGKPNDLGLILKAAPYVILKKGGVSDWGLFVQLFGQPFREYKYNGYDDKVRIQLEKSAQEMGSAPYIILPDGSSLTLHDIKSNPSGEVHNRFVQFCDQQISILVLGNTETTKSSDSSGYAQAETHMETQQAIFTADKKRVRRILNRVVRPILHNLGFDVKDGLFHFKEEVKAADRLSKLSIIEKMKNLGAPVDDEVIYEESGFPKPDNYDDLKAKLEEDKAAQAKQQIPSPGKPGAKPAAKSAAKPKPKAKLTEQDEDGMFEKFKNFISSFFD